MVHMGCRFAPGFDLNTMRFFFILIFTLGSLSLGRAADYDLLVRGGRIVDGTGNPSVHGDVAIRNGRIVAVGRLAGTALQVIDATNRVVTPGFIDVHTHADEIAEQPLGENFIRMGVTTVVAGNCGSSASDIAKFFRELEATNVTPNVATLIGHGTVRGRAMGGSFLRPPTEEELNAMRRSVRTAMEAGALGLSTGLIYLPGTFARTEEIVELAKVAGAYDGIYASHMRDEGKGIFDSVDELLRIAREGGLRAHVSHIKLSGRASWGQTDRVLGRIEEGRRAGLDVTQDQYVYTASSTGISQLIPETAREGGKLAERLADPKQRGEIVEAMKARLRENQNADYSYAMIAEYKPDASLNGLNVVQAALKLQGTNSLEAQIATIFQIQTNGGASGVFHGMSEDDLQMYLRHPNTMIACDASVRVYQQGVPHPRGYGNNARVLARYVRDLQILPLEDAVRRMTLLPATTFRLRDRGQIRVGAWADLCVFNLQNVQDPATFTDPHHYATGFDHVLVNGVPVVTQDRVTGARPGKALRHVRDETVH